MAAGSVFLPFVIYLIALGGGQADFPIMGPKDRAYFMLRAEQEIDAAAHATSRTVRGRHEELAWLYQMRVNYIDRGLVSEVAEALSEPIEPAPEPVQQVIIQAL